MFKIVKREEMSEGNVILNEIEAPKIARKAKPGQFVILKANEEGERIPLTMAETDPELGANLMLFFFSEWDELLDVPRLGEMVPDLVPLVARLKAADASQYRGFRFDDNNAIQACFSFVCMSGDMADIPADTQALGQALGAMLTWADGAFKGQSPLVTLPETRDATLHAEIASLIRAAYDPVMPAATDDPVHALRLAARMAVYSQES